MVEVDINSLVFANNTNTTSMFNKCTALTTIYRNDHLENVLDATKSPMMFNECENLPHYDGTSDKTYAYPDNGESGYFTSTKPKITFKFADGDQGHFEYKGYAIEGYIEVDYQAEISVKAVCDEEGKKVKTVTDNTGKSYEIDEDGFFTVNCLASYTITAQNSEAIQAYAALSSSSNATNDTLTFHYDNDIDKHGALA